MSVLSVMVTGDDPELVRRLTNHVLAFAGESAAACEPIEYACVTVYDYGSRPSDENLGQHVELALILGLNRIRGLFSAPGDYDHSRYNPWSSFWYTLGRLLPSWWYTKLRGGFNARNADYKKWRRDNPLRVHKILDDDGAVEGDPRYIMNQETF